MRAIIVSFLFCKNNESFSDDNMAKIDRFSFSKHAWSNIRSWYFQFGATQMDSDLQNQSQNIHVNKEMEYTMFRIVCYGSSIYT